MRVPDEVLKCVGFIGEVTHKDESGSSGDLHATGFFISVPCEAEELKHLTSCYFVTAKHVALDLKGKEVYFLVNKIGGGVTTIEQHGGNWWLHPDDKAADVAVIEVGGQAGVDWRNVSAEHFVTPDLIQRLDIGVGDEVFMTGLFTEAPGEDKNLPIVRHGNIAMMPDEQIQTELGYADVYLVEGRSIGGLSGSPVFVRPTMATFGVTADGSKLLMYAPGPGVNLLGLAHGHWDIKESEMNKPFFTHDRKRGVNLGICIVTPALKILETLYREELVKRRREQERNLIRKSVPGMDSAKTDTKTQFTQEDFNNALKQVSRKISPKK
ncbi:MAG TPA: hypothetical protein VI636_20990 [Candidatus Angelobacter sp.]